MRVIPGGRRRKIIVELRAYFAEMCLRTRAMQACRLQGTSALTIRTGVSGVTENRMNVSEASLTQEEMTPYGF